MIEVLPCPFCGSNDIDFNEDAQAIVCNGCMTDYNKGMSVLEKWNTRHSPWILVKDRLPENESRVFCWENGSLYDSFFINGNFKLLENPYGLFSIPNVTHWLPLPTRPK